MQNQSRKYKVLFGLLFAGLLAATLMTWHTPSVNAQATGQGKIQGRVVNGTKGAQSASTVGLQVTLIQVAQGATSYITATTQTNNEGAFVFSNLDTVTTTRYLALTNYGTVEYYGDVLSFASSTSATLTSDIQVYETTEDASVVKVTQAHLVFDVDSPWFVVQEILSLENSSDRTYIGSTLGGPHRKTLNIPVLPQAINLTFNDPNVDDTTMRGEEVLTYTLPVMPGKDQIAMQYEIPFVPPTYNLSFKVPFALEKLNIYLVDPGTTPTISSQQLTPATAPMASVPGAPKFVSAASGKLEPGTVVKATFNNLPAAQPGSTTPATTPTTTATDNTQLIGLIVLGVAAVAAVALLAYPLMRRRTHARPAAVPVDNERMDLLQQIADLDDEHDEGKVTDAEYQERRAALKAKLLELDK